MDEGMIPLLILVGAVCGGVFGYMFGLMKAMMSISSLKAENERLTKQVDKLVKALPNHKEAEEIRNQNTRGIHPGHLDVTAEPFPLDQVWREQMDAIERADRETIGRVAEEATRKGNKAREELRLAREKEEVKPVPIRKSKTKPVDSSDVQESGQEDE